MSVYAIFQTHTTNNNNIIIIITWYYVGGGAEWKRESKSEMFATLKARGFTSCSSGTTRRRVARRGWDHRCWPRLLV